MKIANMLKKNDKNLKKSGELSKIVKNQFQPMSHPLSAILECGSRVGKVHLGGPELRFQSMVSSKTVGTPPPEQMPNASVLES